VINFFYRILSYLINNYIYFFFLFFFFIFFVIKIFQNFSLKKYFFNKIHSFLFNPYIFLFPNDENSQNFNDNNLVYLLIEISILLLFGFFYKEIVLLSLVKVQYYLNCQESYKCFILTDNYEFLIFGVFYNENISPYLQLFPWLIFFF
jgi:hypothetical protein